VPSLRPGAAVWMGVGGNIKRKKGVKWGAVGPKKGKSPELKLKNKMASLGPNSNTIWRPDSNSKTRWRPAFD